MRTRILLSTALVTLFGLGCDSKKASTHSVGAADTSRAIGVPGGKIVLSSLGGPKTFNPIVANESSSNDFSTWIFQGLLESDPVTGLPMPGLAQSWTSDSSGDRKSVV